MIQQRKSGKNPENSGTRQRQGTPSGSPGSLIALAGHRPATSVWNLGPVPGPGARWQHIRALPGSCTFAEAEKYLASRAGFGRGNRTCAANRTTPCDFHSRRTRSGPSGACTLYAERARAVSQDRVAHPGNEPWMAETQASWNVRVPEGFILGFRGHSSARSRRRRRPRSKVVAKRPIRTAERAKSAPT